MSRLWAHYSRLGVPPNAADAQVREAFRRLAQRYHPDGAEQRATMDHGARMAAARKFQAISESYNFILRERRGLLSAAERNGGRQSGKNTRTHAGGPWGLADDVWMVTEVLWLPVAVGFGLGLWGMYAARTSPPRTHLRAGGTSWVSEPPAPSLQAEFLQDRQDGGVVMRGVYREPRVD
mmetsp:Transcript_36115/g.88255  ORF Transcript_36115/g.88255 Transcript_36115/m.88255 type:complete len:179 (+) Transcript_36115:1110-1646(+)